MTAINDLRKRIETTDASYGTQTSCILELDERLTALERPPIQFDTRIPEVDFQQKATQRGARMQIMREWMQAHTCREHPQYKSIFKDFCEDHPEAADWFDEDGVPE